MTDASDVRNAVARFDQVEDVSDVADEAPEPTVAAGREAGDADQQGNRPDDREQNRERVDPAALEEAYQVYVTRYLPRAPYASLDGVRTILEEIGLTTPEALSQDPARFVDDRFVRELDASGFIGSLYP